MTQPWPSVSPPAMAAVDSGKSKNEPTAHLRPHKAALATRARRSA